MRFLVDTNLPPAVAVLITSLGHDAQHTSTIGLERATDRDLWRHAKAVGCSIVTKDEDFVLFKPLTRTDRLSCGSASAMRCGGSSCTGSRRLGRQSLPSSMPASP